MDAGGDTIEVSLSVANGSLALNDTTGLSLTDGDGGDGTLSVTGSQAAINAALANGLVYTPDANFNGTDTLTVVADDLGHNGTGGPLVTTTSADITVNAVNDAPVIEGVGSAVFDSFDDGTLDTTLWRTTNTNTGGSIVESGGSLQITLREHLTSQDTFVPTASQPVTVSGEFSFGLLQDTFTVVTRSDGVPFASTGEIANGLLFAVQASSGTDTGYLALLELENGRGTFQSVAPTFQIGVNTVYAFEVIDNGLNVSITLTDTAVPANTVTLSATSTLDTGSNLVSVYNRGGGIGTPVVTLDELSIENLTPPSGVLQVTEDTALSSAIVASDVDGDALSFTLTTDAGNGAVALAPDGAFTYTPDADFFGTDSFTVEVTDGTATVTQTINLNVTPVNDPLVVTGETITVAEDTTTGCNVLISDTVADGLDVDGDLLRVTNTSSFANPFTTASGGSLVLLADGNLSYTPDANFFGTDSFDYTVTDGQRSTETATVTFDVTPVDDPLVVTGETITVAEDTTTGGNVLINDTVADGLDVDGDLLRVTNTSSFANPFTTASCGSLVLLADGNLSYTPDANFFGTDSFDYTVTDGQGITETATVTFDVTPVDDPLVVTGETITVAEDTTTGGNVLINDTVADGLDVDGDLLRVTNTSSFASPFTTANGGSLVLLADGNLSYTPDANFNGLDSFDYTVTDGHGSTATATVTFDVTPVNTAPVAADDATSHGTTILNFSTSSASDWHSFEINGETYLAVANNWNGSSNDINSAIYKWNGSQFIQTQSIPTHGALDWESFELNGETYLAMANSKNTGNIFDITSDLYRLDTDSGLFVPATNVTLAISTDEDTPLTIQANDILANDTDVDAGDALTVTGVSATSAQGAAVVLNGTNIDYDPTNAAALQALAAGESLTDTFTYDVSDGNGGTAPTPPPSPSR